MIFPKPKTVNTLPDPAHKRAEIKARLTFDKSSPSLKAFAVVLKIRHFSKSEGQTMKTIGLLGGMSWESSIEYYRIINETVKEKLGGLHSAECVMYSVDFAPMEVLQRQGQWQEAAQHLVAAAQNIESAGADFIVLCTNTMHKVADDIQSNIAIPLLHIADATAQRVRAAGLKTIGLLGTRFTMEEDFYKGRLSHNYGLDVIIPDDEEREIVHRVIYDELVLGNIRPDSQAQYLQIMEQLVQSGAEGIILGCTEIGLLVHDEDSHVPLFDTTRIHAVAAVEYALS
jgi:aspartate racemase